MSRAEQETQERDLKAGEFSSIRGGQFSTRKSCAVITEWKIGTQKEGKEMCAGDFEPTKDYSFIRPGKSSVPLISS